MTRIIVGIRMIPVGLMVSFLIFRLGFSSEFITVGAYVPGSRKAPPRVSVSMSRSSDSGRHEVQDHQQHQQQHRRQPEDDLAIESKRLVVGQLGYLPVNYVGVSAWKRKKKNNKDGLVVSLKSSDENIETEPRGATSDSTSYHYVPVAIQTYPLNGGAKRRRAKATLLPAVEQKQPLSTNDGSDSSMNRTTSSPTIQSPFPTLFWLTCPEISKAISDLEGHGFIETIEKKLRESPSMRERLIRCHHEYARMRWDSLSEEDQQALMIGGQDTTSPFHGMYKMIEKSGISGSIITKTIQLDKNEQVGDEDIGDEAEGLFPVPNIKCLHAHYAHFRSTNVTQLSLPSESPLVPSIATKNLTPNPVGEMIHEELMSRFPGLSL